MELEEAIAAHMKWIDPILSEERGPMKTRPSSAARLFVKHAVIRVSDDTIDDYSNQPWFAVIYHHVEQWYRDHYGAAFDADDIQSTAAGVVLVRGIPIQIRVPLTTVRAETPGETIWVRFPNVVEADEDPLSWLVGSPNLDRLQHEERAKLIKMATDVATCLRATNINLQGVDPSDATIRGFISGVMSELETAAHNIQRDDAKRWGSALWALQMAIERTLKALDQQQHGSFREIHDLFLLFDRVTLQGNRNLLKKLPRGDQIMDLRYGLGDQAQIDEVIDAYMAALSIVSAASHAMKRRLSFGGGGILMRKPPWITLPSIEGRE